ncbi:peptide ABC transporter substrate-binding protein [Lichenicoccus sp.]|uniref:peptide ABC transporter substrate-binding protein n=1 Tax=Lichenicoccus sp. TaxID=2781899 RepID=UPI003D11134F
MPGADRFRRDERALSVTNAHTTGAMLAAAIICAAAAPAPTCGTVVLPSGLGQADPQAVNSLNPLLTSLTYNLQIMQQIYRPLVWLDRHVNYDPGASLASAVTTSDGGRTWHFTIKPWHWSDGVPVTASDVLFTFETIRRLGPAYVSYGIGGIPDFIADVRSDSRHDVTLTLDRSVNPDWFLRTGLSIMVLPEHVYRGMTLEQMRMRQTDPDLFRVSDGPFMLDDFVVGRHLTLVRNPLYGGTKPAIHRLVVDFLEGGSPLQALRAGEIDAADIPFRLWDLARALPGFATTRLDGPFGYMVLYLNMHSATAPSLRDVRVRRAIALAIDQAEMIALAWHGQAGEVHGPVPPAMTGFVSQAAREGYPSLRHDPAQARALLDEAGWRPGPDGIRTRNGRALRFSIGVSAGVVDRLVELQVAQRNLAAVGIAVDLHGLEFNDLIATMRGNGHDWEGNMIGQTIEGYPDGQQFFSADGASNYGHYEDAKMDALNRAVVSDAGAQALQAAQDYTAGQQPVIFLPDGAISLLARPEVHGLREMESPLGSWSPELLSLSGDMACNAERAAR